MQCSCVCKHTRFLSICLEKLINSLWTLAIPKSTRTVNPKSHTKCISLTRTYVKTPFETFLPIVMDTEKHDFEFISSQRYWIRSFILFISTKKDPFIHDKKINLRKLWEINFTSNTDVTHHFYVSSLGESIEIKVQKQCGKTLFGNEEFLFLCRLGPIFYTTRKLRIS